MLPSIDKKINENFIQQNAIYILENFIVYNKEAYLPSFELYLFFKNNESGANKNDIYKIIKQIDTSKLGYICNLDIINYLMIKLKHLSTKLAINEICRKIFVEYNLEIYDYFSKNFKNIELSININSFVDFFKNNFSIEPQILKRIYNDINFCNNKEFKLSTFIDYLSDKNNYLSSMKNNKTIESFEDKYSHNANNNNYMCNDNNQNISSVLPGILNKSSYSGNRINQKTFEKYIKEFVNKLASNDISFHDIKKQERNNSIFRENVKSLMNIKDQNVINYLSLFEFREKFVKPLNIDFNIANTLFQIIKTNDTKKGQRLKFEDLLIFLESYIDVSNSSEKIVLNNDSFVMLIDKTGCPLKLCFESISYNIKGFISSFELFKKFKAFYPSIDSRILKEGIELIEKNSSKELKGYINYGQLQQYLFNNYNIKNINHINSTLANSKYNSNSYCHLLDLYRLASYMDNYPENISTLNFFCNRGIQNYYSVKFQEHCFMFDFLISNMNLKEEFFIYLCEKMPSPDFSYANNYINKVSSYNLIKLIDTIDNIRQNKPKDALLINYDFKKGKLIDDFKNNNFVNIDNKSQISKRSSMSKKIILPTIENDFGATNSAVPNFVHDTSFKPDQYAPNRKKKKVIEDIPKPINTIKVNKTAYTKHNINNDDDYNEFEDAEEEILNNYNKQSKLNIINTNKTTANRNSRKLKPIASKQKEEYSTEEEEEETQQKEVANKKKTKAKKIVEVEESEDEETEEIVKVVKKKKKIPNKEKVVIEKANTQKVDKTSKHIVSVNTEKKNTKSKKITSNKKLQDIEFEYELNNSDYYEAPFIDYKTKKYKKFLTILNSEDAAIKTCENIFNNKSLEYFTDNEFGESETDKLLNGHSLYINGKGNKGNLPPESISWYRIDQIYYDDTDNKKSPLFLDDGAESNDVMQGALGDCWFIGALSVIATKEYLLKGQYSSSILEDNIVDNEEMVMLSTGVYPPIFHAYRKKRIYCFKFYKNFRWRYVIIDDRLPCRKIQSNLEIPRLIYAKCRSEREFWVPLIEKAYAKLHGSYQALISGFIDEGLVDLTGLVSYKFIVTKEMSENINNKAEDLWNNIITWCSDNHNTQFLDKGNKSSIKKKIKMETNNYSKIKTLKANIFSKNKTMLGCSVDSKTVESEVVYYGNHCGILASHAYSILDAFEIPKTDSISTNKNKAKDKINSNEEQNIRLLRIRNPWGFKEWNGKWSDQSDELERYRDIIQNILCEKYKGSNEKIDLEKEDGTFLMSFNDFRKIFSKIYICIDFPPDVLSIRFSNDRWDSRSSGGVPVNNSPKEMEDWSKNPQYYMYVPKDNCELVISLVQRDGRSFNDVFPYSKNVKKCCLIIMNANKTGKKKMECFDGNEVKHISPIRACRENTIKENFDRGEYLIVPSILNKGETSEFQLEIHFPDSIKEGYNANKNKNFTDFIDFKFEKIGDNNIKRNLFIYV